MPNVPSDTKYSQELLYQVKIYMYVCRDKEISDFRIFPIEVGDTH